MSRIVWRKYSSLCDRVSVLKDGRMMGTRDVAATTTDELIRLMVGRDVELERDASVRSFGDVVLEVDALAAAPFVRNASLKVRQGEIVCLAGLVGSGRSETCEAIFGARPMQTGQVRLKGRPVRFKGPRDAIAAGLGMAQEDRKDAGLFLTMDVASNISAAVLDRVLVRRARVARAFRRAGQQIHWRVAYRDPVDAEDCR